MKNDVLSKFYQLVQKTQSHILQHYKPHANLLTTKECYDFFSGSSQRKIIKEPKAKTPSVPKKPESSDKDTIPSPVAPASDERKKTFKLNPLNKQPIDDFKDFKEIYSRYNPSDKIIEPSEKHLKKDNQDNNIATNKAIILFSSENWKTSFISFIKASLSFYFDQVEFIQSNQVVNDPNVKLILVEKKIIDIKSFRMSPNRKQSYYKGIPAIILEDEDLYLNHVEEKKKLWHQLKNTLLII